MPTRSIAHPIIAESASDRPIFVDANVVLEVTLRKRRFVAIAERFLSDHQTVASPLTAHLLVHFGRKEGRSQWYLFSQVKELQFTEFGGAEVGWAMANGQGDDFEDALQVACAVLHGCNVFATFDQRLARRYRPFISVRVLGASKSLASGR